MILQRGRNIPNDHVLNFNLTQKPLNIFANIQGSDNNVYIINIFRDKEDKINLIHDCPYFKKGLKICKHIIKLFLICDYETCAEICENIKKINFSSNIGLVSQSKAESFVLKAEQLIEDGKYLEAINYLGNSYEESENINDIEKILEIAKANDFPDQYLKYVSYSPKLIKKYVNNYEQQLTLFFSKQDEYSFSHLTNIIIDIQDIFSKLPEGRLDKIFQSIDFKLIENPLLRYMLLKKFLKKVQIPKYFPELLKEIGWKKNADPSIFESFFSDTVFNLVNEAILNMESEDMVIAFLTIAENCQFENYTTILHKVDYYKQQLDRIYLEGLKLKHAFIRSLVITNYKTNKLAYLEFYKKRRYPLIWTTPTTGENPLYYYILHKCGFDPHHMDYISIGHFLENYPVFAEIFSCNNPISEEVESYWGEKEPKIQNIVYITKFQTLDFKLNDEDIKNHILIEWDLAQSPILGSYICQYSDGFIIPDPDHPLTPEIRPFDLIICHKEPIAIKGKNVKIFRPIKKVNLKTAIELVYSSIEFIVNYLPFNIIIRLRNMKIDEIDAYLKAKDELETLFSPKKEEFINNFKDFIDERIKKDLNEIYLKLTKKPKHKDKILNMIGFQHYAKIFHSPSELQSLKRDNLKRDSLYKLKLDFYKFISQKLENAIKEKTFHLVNLTNLKKYPKFKKWTIKLIYELKKQLEDCKIYQVRKNVYDIHELVDTHTGKKIIQYHKMNVSKNQVSKQELEVILEDLKFLRIQLPQIVNK